MTHEPQIAMLFALTTGAGSLMALAGILKSGLERRRHRRICPSCGRQLVGRSCACSR